MKTLIERFKQWRKNRRYTVKCPFCNEKFNAHLQAGICPHIPIKEFLYGKK
jgi:C4-type Zn-finger protein